MGIAHQTAASCRGKVLQSSCYMNQPQLMFSLFILWFLSFVVVEGGWDSGAVSPVPAYVAAGLWAERHVCGSGCCAEAPEGPYLGFSWALCCHGVVWCGAAHRAVAAPSSLPQTRGEGFLTHPGGSHGTLKGLVPPSLGKQKAVGAPSQHSPMLGPCSPHLLEQVGALVIQ